MMKIESVAARPDRVGRYLVKLSDGSSLKLYRQTVEDFGLFAGLDLSEEELSRIRKDAGQMSAKMRAVRIISASNVSKKDLEQRLLRKGETPQEARNAVQWLSGLNLLDDRETARQIVSHCVAKGYGIARAKQALYDKKIPKDLWEEALLDYPDQSEKIMEYLRAKLYADSDSKLVKKTVDALIRRGHSYSVIRRCLSCLELDDTELREEY